MTDPTPPQSAPGAYGEHPTLVPPTAPPYAAPGYPPPPYGSAPMQPSPGAPPVMPYGYGAYTPPPPTNGLAVASLVLSILGLVWVLPVIGSIAGTIMGHSSLGQIARRGEGGRGMALAGTIIGWIGIGLSVLGIVFFVSLIAVASTSSSRI